MGEDPAAGSSHGPSGVPEFVTHCSIAPGLVAQTHDRSGFIHQL